MANMRFPKISDITKVLANPESQFSSMVKESIGFELPPGPLTMLLKFQKSVEAGETPKPEDFIPRDIKDILPELPRFPFGREREYEEEEERPKRRPRVAIEGGKIY